MFHTSVIQEKDIAVKGYYILLNYQSVWFHASTTKCFSCKMLKCYFYAYLIKSYPYGFLNGGGKSLSVSISSSTLHNYRKKQGLFIIIYIYIVIFHVDVYLSAGTWHLTLRFFAKKSWTDQDIEIKMIFII